MPSVDRLTKAACNGEWHLCSDGTFHPGPNPNPLIPIATELVTRVRKSVTIDWTLRESARAKIKVLVKRILSKHGYPPDLRDEATKLVLQQAELLCAEWAA
jgi:hypothetical protein